MTGRIAITELLNAARAGDEGARETAYALVYDELKRCARALRGATPGSTLTPTALVNELYLRLARQGEAPVRDREHFFSLAARAMRQILVDHARRRLSVKRGAGAPHLDADDDLALPDDTAQRALELDSALDALRAHDDHLARVVEWHFFAGLGFREIGDELQRHERTVRHDWELARAFLRRAMSPAASRP